MNPKTKTKTKTNREETTKQKNKQPVKQPTEQASKQLAKPLAMEPKKQNSVLGKDLSTFFSSRGDRAWRPTKPGGRNGNGKPT